MQNIIDILASNCDSENWDKIKQVLGDVASPQSFFFPFVATEDIRRLLDGLQNDIPLLVKSLEKYTPTFDQLRAHRIHNLSKSFSKADYFISDLINGSNLTSNSLTRQQLITTLQQDPCNVVVSAAVLAVVDVLKDLSKYRVLSIRRDVDDCDPDLINSIGLLEQQLGEDAQQAQSLLSNLFVYYLSFLSQDPKRQIELTVMPDDRCIACPVKADGSSFAPHCVETIPKNGDLTENEDCQIIHRIVLLKNFAAKRSSVIDMNKQFATQSDELAGINDFCNQMLIDVELTSVELRKWTEMIVVELIDSGIDPVKIRQAITNMQNSNESVYELLCIHLDEVQINRHKNLQPEHLSAITIFIDENSQTHVALEMWLLIDPIFGRATDVSGSRYRRF